MDRYGRPLPPGNPASDTRPHQTESVFRWSNSCAGARIEGLPARTPIDPSSAPATVVLGFVGKPRDSHTSPKR
jgi:hypothetical protein